jgi:hypothetical protein
VLFRAFSARQKLLYQKLCGIGRDAGAPGEA